MERAYIPRLEEHEARMLILRILSNAKKGQLTSSELKEEFPKYRKMSNADLSPSDTRSGAPVFHQIVQNATDRLDQNKGFYDPIYTQIIHADGKIVRITDAGRKFIKRYLDYVEFLQSGGFEEFEFYDESGIDYTWNLKIGKMLKMSKLQFVKCIQSSKFSASLQNRLEENGEIARIAELISRKIRSDISEGKNDITQCRSRPIDAWLFGRYKMDLYPGLPDLYLTTKIIPLPGTG